MTRTLSTSDFCESCLEIRCAGNTVKEILNSQGYATPIGPCSLNYSILYGLQDNGGCPGCINMVESATAG